MKEENENLNTRSQSVDSGTDQESDRSSKASKDRSSSRKRSKSLNIILVTVIYAQLKKTCRRQRSAFYGEERRVRVRRAGYCRVRGEKSEPTIGFDTAENKPRQVCCMIGLTSPDLVAFLA